MLELIKGLIILVGGSTLGGARHEVIIQHLRPYYYDKAWACMDCLVFIENGEDPEGWEG